MLELRDMDLGDISKSLSDRYRNDSRRCGKFCSTSPALGEPPSNGERAPWPFSTSKLQRGRKNWENRLAKYFSRITAFVQSWTNTNIIKIMMVTFYFIHRERSIHPKRLRNVLFYSVCAWCFHIIYLFHFRPNLKGPKVHLGPVTYT